MKSIFFSLILWLFSCYLAFSADISFTGKVIDAQTKAPLPGASITIQDLKTSALTDINGNFSFNRIPERGKFLVQVSYIGYKYLSKVIDFAQVKTMVFEMEPSLIEANEVVVTGTVTGADSKKNSTSVGILTHDEMFNRPATNIIDAISKVSGVSQITTGQAISKPVIRGLSYNRIVTINDGIKQQGQQWGDEHGVEIDQYSADRVEVLRGAASLLYGADALGGVINILEPLTVPNGNVKGELVSNYSTNGGLSSNSLMLTGNNDGLVWRARGTYKNAYSFKTPSYYYPNSGFNETDFSGMLGLNKSWGYSHLNLSYFKNNIGFYEPKLDANGNFLNEKENPYTLGELKERELESPSQDIQHFKIALNNNFLFNKGNLKLDLGFQNNIRKELFEGNPNLFFDLNTYSADAKYFVNEKNGWQPVIGLSTDYASSLNKGSEYLVPNYNNYGIGVFYYLKKDWEKASFNAGLRYDYRYSEGKELIAENGDQQFAPFKTNFSNLSGAIGFTKQLSSKLNFKTNLSTGFRAPNPAEQGSNGVHEGTFRYEVGNPNLKSERSYQLDLNLQYTLEILEINVGVFNNYMTNYIYLAQRNNETIIAPGENGSPENFPLYRYLQDNANLYGTELSLIIHPIKSLHLENTFSYTHAQNLALNRPLPFIPAASLRNELKFEPNLKGLKSPYVAVGLDNYFAQNRVDNFETTTSGYSLLRASLGTQINVGKQVIRLNIAANNLLNKAYYDHLSRFKPGRLSEENPSFGIYNPGRNITFGLSAPLNFK
ncbi:TonB-dependent receptor [Pelobium sp.]|nr:TonB-dependent receptor [Pelobium sp.]MDA9554810.1 TonB-dependent receptor [Pelobium sp.]